MRFLVLGASGFVGSALLRRIPGGGHEVVATYRRRRVETGKGRAAQVDMTDGRAVMDLVEETDARAIVSLVAESDPRAAESEAARAEAASIRRSLSAVAAECKRAERHLTLLSTDYVFDCRSGPYSESDPVSPEGEYGRDKVAAEGIVLTSGAPALVVRTSLVYGWPEPGVHPNFASNVVSSLRVGGRVEAHSDVTRTPIYVNDLADGITELIEAGATGIYHAGSSDVVSMSGFAHTVCEAFALDQRLVVSRAAAEVDPSRPRRGGLKTQKIAAELRRPLPTTKEGISRMKEEEPAHV